MELSSLKIATWNCNGALRKKFHLLAELGADINVVQECENPAVSVSRDYQEWASNCVWSGSNKNKGLGVFAAPGLGLNAVELNLNSAELVLPLKIKGIGNMLAVWTKAARPRQFRYIAQIWRFLQAGNGFLEDSSALMIGDFNSSALWDYKKNRVCSHTDVVNALEQLEMTSAYHLHHALPHGRENHSTYFMQRKIDSSHHIDYCFTGRSWSVRSVWVGSPAVWLEHSDHMPMVFDLERLV